MTTGTEVAEHYEHQAGTLGEVIRQHEQVGTKLADAATQVASQRALAARELAAIYVPELTDEVFERASQLTGFQGFKRRDPRIAMAQERKVLTSALAQLDADERYQRRETLLGPDGLLQQELDAAKEALAPLQHECDRFEQLEGFTELVAVKYDTPGFTEHWWNAAYWKHWAAGDRICKALGLNDFGDDVLPAYRKYAEPRDVLAADVARISQQIAAAHEIVRRRDETADRLTHLDEIYLVSAQDFLAEHLALADHALLEQWIIGQPEERAVQQGLRRLAGTTAKQQILDEIQQQGMPKMIGDLRQRRMKAMDKAQKFRRPKYSYSAVPASNINPQFDTKMAALQANQQKLSRRIDDLVAFDDYSRFRLTNDSQLWWWYFFNSPPNRYYSPGLFSYYERQPNIDVGQDDADLGDVVTTAAISEGLEAEQGYLS